VKSFLRGASRPGLKPRVYRAQFFNCLMSEPFAAQGKLKLRPPKAYIIR
jgi:hypothetical protein